LTLLHGTSGSAGINKFIRGENSMSIGKSISLVSNAFRIVVSKTIKRIHLAYKGKKINKMDEK